MSLQPDRIVELVEPASVTELVQPWRELVARCGGSYFQLPDWVLAWWDTLGARAPTEVAVWHGPDGLEALAAVTTTRVRLHPSVPLSVRVVVNAGAGAGGADHLGFPALESRRDHVRDWLARRTRRSVLLSNLDDAATWVTPPGAVVVERSVCPRLPIGDGRSLGRSSSYRRQVRSKVRKAVAAGATFTYVPPERFRPELLDRLMELHELRWSQLEGTSSFGRDRLDLHRALITHAAAGRGPAAIVAECDGRTVGIVYGFVWDATFAFFQSGWDPEWAHLGLGTVVHAVATDLLAEAGIGTYDFLRGAEEYKYRFGATDAIDTSVLVPRGLGGVALRAKYRLRDQRAGAADPE